MPKLLPSAQETLPSILAAPWSVANVLVVVVVALGFQVIEMVATASLGPYSPPLVAHFFALYTGGNLQVKLVAYLLNLTVSLSTVSWFLARYRLGTAAIGWRRAELATSMMYIAIMLVALQLGFTFLSSVIQAVVPAFNPHQAQQNYYIQIAGQHRAIAFVTLVVLPPILEETVFRGFVFPALAKTWGLVPGALVSSIIFGLAHAQANLDLYTFMMALALCFMYVRLKSIFPGMVLHMVNNYLAFMAVMGK